MTRLDPLIAGLDAKRTAMLLRDARAVLRRVDVLMATAAAVQDPALAEIAALRDAADHVVTQLGRRGQVEKRHAREAVRRLR